MALHLVRHGEAGDRHVDGDEARTLTARGRSQAEAIAGLLGDRPVRSIRSSRYVRCAETVRPLADHLGLSVVEDDALAEEAEVDDTWQLLESLATGSGDVVLCSHGNILQAMLDRLHRRGVDLVATELSFRKGAVWTLVPGGDRGFLRAELTLPPA